MKKKNKSIEEEILENRENKEITEEEIDVIKPNITNRKKFKDKFQDLKIKYKKDKKKYLVMASSILLLLALVTGTSYAYLTYISKTGNNTVIEAGTLALTFENESNAITLDNALPQQDNDAIENNEEYSFTISNSGTLPATYKITLDNTCTTDRTYEIEGESITPDKCIPLEHIKVGIKEGNNEYQVLEKDKTDYVIASGTLNGNTDKAYKLKIWLDYDTPNEYNSGGTQNIIFSGKLGLDYEQGNEEPVPTAADTIISKVGTDGIVEESHEATIQLEANTDYRYTGANPNNYVSFNNELWRIIGVFPTEDDSGTIENRVKIIRSESIGNIAWDSGNVNNWETATLQTYLNGEYYNSLSQDAQNMIGDSKWYLGGNPWNDVTDLITSNFYKYERGETVYSGRPTSFIGKIGLMYPSDYGYATSGGSTTNREECLEKELSSWSSSDYTDCKNNDWLYDSSNYQWTITPYSADSSYAFLVLDDGNVRFGIVAGGYYAARPVLALASTVEITGGVGTSSDPYILS